MPYKKSSVGFFTGSTTVKIERLEGKRRLFLTVPFFQKLELFAGKNCYCKYNPICV